MMGTIEEFEQHLREALTHLYDPAYQPPQLLWTVIGGNPQQGAESAQAAIIQAIKNLTPTSEIPRNARIRRFYELLSCRYIQGLTQEETAQELGITSRHLRREQQQAVRILALRLWEEKYGRTLSTDDHTRNEGQSPEVIEAETESTTWRFQVRQELASLQKSAPGILADVKDELAGVVKLANALTSGHNVCLNVAPIEPNLTVPVHPSVLRQILITGIEMLAKHMSSGQIVLQAGRENKSFKIIITGQPVVTKDSLDSALIREILTTLGGSIEVHTDSNQTSVELSFPSTDKILVLVVDDNADLVHFYRRYTMGTRYQIIHAAEGQQIFELIEDAPPDIIVLDVMLPDIDGWELLTQLREYPGTKLAPIIVCSVVRREALALALGATLYVPKPVRRQQFIQALDQTLSRVAA